jgi:predicted lipoprotein with Yx(FWY)xxD motif
MRLRPVVGLAGACLLLVAAVIAYRHVHRVNQPLLADFTVPATPPGITLTTLGTPEVEGGVTHLRTIREFLTNGATVYSDAKGKTLYTLDADSPGKSSCAGDCLRAWPAAIAPTEAKPFGDWSVITRDDGSKQWAFKGKPLYSCAQDTAPGDSCVKDTARAQGFGKPGAAADSNSTPAAAGPWHTAVFKPPSLLTALIGHTVFKPAVSGEFPADISVQEVEDAGGQVLIDNLGRTLYAFDGDLKDDHAECRSGASCEANPWRPVYAASLANALGDFTIVKRPDGTGQWAYKGWPLYRYATDLSAGQADGIGVDKRWRPAVLVRYPVPAPVTVTSTFATGKIFATSEGRSLYRQQIFSYNFGHDFQHGTPYYETIGRVLGTRACDGECTKRWRPFRAAADAQPSGHWSIVVRPDGSRQWAYKGYALYTFDGDQKPGDLLGRDTWSTSFSDPALQSVSFLNKLNVNAETVSGVFWTSVYP